MTIFSDSSQLEFEESCLKTEFLILVPNDDSFCNSKKAFIDFLQVDALISIIGQKMSYKRSVKEKELLSVPFRVETDKVKSKEERYFLLVLECQDELLVDEFSELGERIKTIANRISPEKTIINTIWDDVGRIYAEKSYPLINEVENLMRRLIAKFMLITVGMNWSKDAIHYDLFKKIEKFEEEELYLNDLHKLDFIHLKQVLFEKKRDISLEEIDRLLSKTNFSEEDQEKILKYIPRSNWEKYFSVLIEEKDSNLEKKWELLYKLRNKVAHNRNVTKEEFEKIKGLSLQIKEVIMKATAKLGEIEINEEDRELIIYSYNSDSPQGMYYLSQKAVEVYYIKSGFKVTLPTDQYFDFLAMKETQIIAVEVKYISHRSTLQRFFNSQIKHMLTMIERNFITKVHLVCVLGENDNNYPRDQIFSYAQKYAQKIPEDFSDCLEIFWGKLSEENKFILLDL